MTIHHAGRDENPTKGTVPLPPIRQYLRQSLLLFGLLLFSVGLPAEESLSFGIVPQQSASKLASLWVPLLREVEQRSGVKLWFHTAPDIPTFEQRVAAGEYDFAYMNPYHYTVFSQAPGYRAFAKEQDKRIKGVVVVPKASPLNDITQLQGQQLAFPAPAAFAASVLPRASFEKKGISINADYVGSHDSVYRAVVKGLYPAGGGVVRTLNNMDAAIREQLRILWSTNGYTPHAFATHPRVPQQASQRVTAAFVSLGKDEVGRKLLDALRFKPLETALDSDWDDVRSLNIQLLSTPGGK